MKGINLSKQDIINRIAYFRNKKKMSAYELSLSLGHSTSYFYRIENGEINLSMDLFLDVLKVLDITTFEFFYLDLDNYEQDIKNLNIIKSISEEQMQSIKTLLNVN